MEQPDALPRNDGNDSNSRSNNDDSDVADTHSSHHDDLSPRSNLSGISSRQSSRSSRSSFASVATSSSSVSTPSLRSYDLSNQSAKQSNASEIDEDEALQQLQDDVIRVASPDPNRAQPIKYNVIQTKLRNFFLRDWGVYGKQTTWDVTSEFKERFRLKQERAALKELRDARDTKQRTEAADKKWRADNFRHKKFLQDQKIMFDNRREDSKEAAAHRAQVAWKRVNDRETVGRVVAEAAAVRHTKEAKDAHDAFVEATRIANEAAKKKSDDDAAHHKQLVDDDDEFADNLARKFGVYAGIPQPVLPEPVPGLPPKQATHITVGWIEGEAPMEDSDDEEEDQEEHVDDEVSGGVNGRLSADLFVYAYAESLRGQKLGQEGARALAKVLSPRLKEGHRGKGSGGNQDGVEPGACENVTKLVLRSNNLHLHGTRYITQMFPKGGLPLLQVLDLAGNKIGCTGARHVAEAMSEPRALQHLKVLDLSSNVICDQGGYSLASGFYVGKCKKLETIKLCDNWMGSKGILAVIRSLSTQPYKKLRMASLRRNRLRPKMLKRLRDDHAKWLSL